VTVIVRCCPLLHAPDMPQGRLTQETAWVATGWVHRWMWASVLAGWVLTTVVLAVLTGLLKWD
jgi:hypothetical protein